MMSGYERRDSGSEPSGAGASGAKIRVYELAKEIGMAPKDLVAKIRTLGVEAANHMSNLDGPDVDRIRRAIERERQESLVEERLSDTVIRRRSRSVPAAAAPPAVARPAAPAPPPPLPPPVVEPPAPVALPEPPPPVVVVAPPDELATPMPVVDVHVVAVSEPTPEVMPVVAEEPPAPAVVEPLPEPPAEVTPPPIEAKPAIQGPVPVKIPQPVVTGSAATGQFIQLPGLVPRDGGVPKIEIKDRD